MRVGVLVTFRKAVSGVLALANRTRIKPSHRRRRKAASAHLVYILNNPLSGTDPTGYAACSLDDEASCLLQDDGINTIVDKGGNTIATTIVANKGDNITVTGNGGSISATFTGKTGDISRVLAGGPASDIGAISQRTNGTLDGTAATYAFNSSAPSTATERLPWSNDHLAQARRTEIFNPWIEATKSFGWATGDFFFGGPTNAPGDDSIQQWGSIPLPAAAGGMAIKVGGGVLLRVIKTEMHHAWPKYLGGAQKQILEKLPHELHNAFHQGLDKTVPRYLGKKHYDALTSEERTQVYTKFKEFTKSFDAKHGTNLMDAATREGFPIQ